jgi:hypothetical protein
MSSKTHRWTALAVGVLLAASLGAPIAARAADPKKHHVKCEVTKDGKTETHEVASADECTKMGGKVAGKTHKKK